MRKIASFTPLTLPPLLIVSLIALPSIAQAGLIVDSDACIAQVKEVAQLKIDCALHFSFNTAGITDPTAQAILGVLQGSKCTMPISLAKRDLYDSWITETSIQVPRQTASCALVSAGQTQAFIVTASPSCTKASGQWQCTPNAASSGLGFFDTALSTFLNTFPDIGKAMVKAIDPNAP